MRRTPLSRKLLVAATVPVLALGVTACGDQTTDEAASADEAAADLPAEGEEVDVDDFVADMKEGVQSATTAKTSMTMSFGGSSMEAKGDLDYTAEPPSMAMTMTSQGASMDEMELRMLDGIMYMNMGQMSQDKFVRFDLSDKASLPPGMAGLEEQMDPLAAFDEFGPALKSVTFEGTEDVDGEDLNHFTLQVDTSKIASLKSVPASAGMPPEVEYDVWFDGEYLMRQMEVSMDMSTPVDIEAKMYDWGEPVQIEAPPKDEVVDGSKMAG